MNPAPLIFLLGLGIVRLAGQEANSDQLLRDFEQQSSSQRQAPAKPASLDPKRVINESISLLKEREPELTAEEYALYDKVSALMSTNVELAVRMIETMMSDKDKPSPAFEVVLGNAYLAASQPERAEASYRSALKRYPTFLRAWTNLGALCYSANRFPEAADSLGKAVELGDHTPSTLGMLAYCLEQQGKMVPAEAAYLQAVAADPANGDWREGLLRLALDAKLYGRAEQLVRGLLREKPSDTRLWQTYAGILVADNRHLEAIAVLERAKAAHGLDNDGQVMLGDLYAEQNLVGEAAAVYKDVLENVRDRGEQKLIQFATVLIGAGNLTDAERVLDTLGGNVTPAARAALLQTRAELFLACKRWPEARRELESLLALAPLNGRALMGLGRTYLEENNLPRATLAYEAAVQVPEVAYQANVELANVELKNRHYAQAASRLEKALQIQKNDALEDYLVRLRGLAAPGEKSS